MRIFGSPLGLSESHEQLARATVKELTFENMKVWLIKIFKVTGDGFAISKI